MLMTDKSCLPDSSYFYLPSATKDSSQNSCPGHLKQVQMNSLSPCFRQGAGHSPGFRKVKREEIEAKPDSMEPKPTVYEIT